MKEQCEGKTTTSATQIDPVATITERNYALIAFTIDQLLQLLQLGHTAHGFQCEGKTTTSATQIDPIATIINATAPSLHSQSTNCCDSDTMHMNSLECRKLHSHLGTKQLIHLEQTNLPAKHAHSHQIHHNICCTASTPHRENHQPQRHDMVPTKEHHTLQKSKIPQQNLHLAQFNPIILTLLTRH
jgi:hypothetical protein